MRVLATHSIRQFPLHFPSRASPCAIRFRTSSTHVVQGTCILLSNKLAEPLLNDVLTFHDPVSMFVLHLQIRSRFFGPIRGLSCIFLTTYFLRGGDVTPHATVHLFLSSGPVRNRQLRKRRSCIFLCARYLVTPPIWHWLQ